MLDLTFARNTWLICALAPSLHAATPEDASSVLLTEPAADRWMYSFNGTPGSRTTASTFSALPQPQSESGSDDRLGQFLMRFDTSAAGIPTGLGPANYKIHEFTLTAVVAQSGGVAYDFTPDPLSSFGPRSAPDPDPGRPIELHGTGFRGGFDAATFQESSPFGFGPPGSRNAYALGFDPAGNPRDVSNNVTSGFESFAWAIARFPTLQPGEPIPSYAKAHFRIDSSLPGVSDYLAEGFHRGFVWLTISSLHSATQMGSEGFPAFHTRDHPEQAIFGDVAPRLSITYSLPLTVRHFSRDPSDQSVRLDWNASPGFVYHIESAENPAADFRPRHGPFSTTSPAVLSWSGTSTTPSAFFRVTRSPSP